jgi:transcription elongation factor SPT5
MAFCLMQKFVDLKKYGTKVPIISAFSLDHVRGFFFVEAEKACDVTEVRSWMLPLKSNNMTCCISIYPLRYVVSDY